MKKYTFDEAVELALRTWYPKDHELHLNPHHPLGKLLGEWGELLDDYMKSLYKPDYVFEPQDELGDIWYYVRILCYQRKYEPKIRNCIVFPEINAEINFNDDKEDILITAAIYDLAQISLISETYNDNPADSMLSVLSLNCQYSILNKVAKRHNLTLDDLTRSNWEKLKPGSERGEQWEKARNSNAAKPEPQPKAGQVDIWPLVVEDIKSRVEAGESKYGTVLQSCNGRDALMDSYQEAIDLVMYLRQAIAERD